MVMYAFVTLSAVILGVVIIGLASPPPDPSPDVLALTGAISRFSQKLYKALAKHVDYKIVYSPFSAHLILSVLYLGARNTTADQMKSVLQTSSLSNSHEVYKSLIEYLNTVARDVVFTKIEAVFSQEDKVLLKYITDVDNYYKFTGNSYARLPSRDISSTTIYNPPITFSHKLDFNCTWKSQFNPGNTNRGQFKNKKGYVKDIDFMNQVGTFGVKLSAAENVDVVRLPFENERFAFYVVLPRTLEDFPSLEEIVSADNFDDSIFFSGVEEAYVNITVPKFDISSFQSLDDALENQGMAVAFSKESDFSGIREQPNPIKFVMQLAGIEVSETGANTASMSYVNMGPASSQNDPVKLVADHSFIFYVRDDASRLILLQGKQTDPSKKIFHIDP
ncbi:unnamed protein product [Lymnaea stagnalis]|uniref:Serpin domain-containing protein n=1 Tax=Lymnaea stagnalis TaxID=6523 RepID=A0AAV2IK86_LYMST